MADPNWVSESAADNVTCVHLCDDMYYRMTDGSAHQYKPVELCDAKTFMQKVATTGSCGEWVLGENDRQLCEVSTFFDDMLGENKQCEWIQKRYNFDDIGQAFMAMFTAATLAGFQPRWSDFNCGAAPARRLAASAAAPSSPMPLPPKLRLVIVPFLSRVAARCSATSSTSDPRKTRLRARVSSGSASAWADVEECGILPH